MDGGAGRRVAMRGRKTTTTVTTRRLGLRERVPAVLMLVGLLLLTTLILVAAPVAHAVH
jgi:hypothetical protein